MGDELTTSSESSETVGQRFEVSPRIQSNIPTVVVIINISVNHLPSGETLLQVKRSVWSPPGEPDEFEVPGLSTTRKKNKHILFDFFSLVQPSSVLIPSVRKVLVKITSLLRGLISQTFLVFDLRI